MGNIEKLILATVISDNAIDQSTTLDNQTKIAIKNLSLETRTVVEKEPKINSSSLNSLKSALLTYWNESISPETEFFWSELVKNGIDYPRAEPLKFALEKGRFKRVDQGMQARKNWSILKSHEEILNKYTRSEIQKIEEIISKDEKTRTNLLKKCLVKREIPRSQYLKFGECMAYISNTGISEKYFSEKELNDLYEIWNSF